MDLCGRILGMRNAKKNTGRRRVRVMTVDDGIFESAKTQGDQTVRSVYVSCPNLYAKFDTAEGIWECGYGWYPVLERLSRDLERLNDWSGDTFGVYVVAHQVKEKFGMLRFYYGVEARPRGLLGKLAGMFHSFAESCAPRSWRSTGPKPSGGSVFSRVMFGLGCAFGGVGDFIADLSCGKGTSVDYVREVVEKLVYDKIVKAAHACHDRCERCGRAIGVRGSPRVSTKGWITYVCKNCAETIEKREKAESAAAKSRAGRCTSSDVEALNDAKSGKRLRRRGKVS